jgi:hypothetical protein
MKPKEQHQQQQLPKSISTIRPAEDLANEELELRGTHDRFIKEGGTEEMWWDLRNVQRTWPKEEFDIWVAAQKSNTE